MGSVLAALHPGYGPGRGLGVAQPVHICFVAFSRVQEYTPTRNGVPHLYIL